MQKTLKYYRGLSYTLRAEPQEDSSGRYWIAEYVELQGCKTDGDSESEAIASVQELFDEYVAAALEKGLDIPEPVIEKPEIIREVKRVVPRKVLKTLSASEPGETKVVGSPRVESPVGTTKSEGTRIASEATYEEFAEVDG